MSLWILTPGFWIMSSELWIMILWVPTQEFIGLCWLQHNPEIEGWISEPRNFLLCILVVKPLVDFFPWEIAQNRSRKWVKHTIRKWSMVKYRKKTFCAEKHIFCAKSIVFTSKKPGRRCFGSCIFQHSPLDIRCVNSQPKNLCFA